MTEEEYQEFLDWLRCRDIVRLLLEDGTELARGHRPQSEIERLRMVERHARTAHRPWMTFYYSALVVRKWHGDANVEAFFAATRQVKAELDKEGA